MKVLLIAPLPPPITGHSMASQMLVDGLGNLHETTIVNLSLGSHHDGRVTVRRIWEVVKVALVVGRKQRWADVIYFTISESRAGNLKDLVIYLLCRRRLNRMFVHLHGGTIGRALFDRSPVWRGINAWFIKRLGGVIVSGVSHVEIFSGMIDPRHIHTVPNSADDDLFVEESTILDKFARARPLRVLYLSSMTIDKGYLDLADAWFSLAPDLRAFIQLDFAGRFGSDADRVTFEDRIRGVEGISYHGLVDRERKRCLFAGAHVFCLPTRMSEGQPISILEAYAAGCVVLTTNKPGIRDVFTDGVNGFEVIERSPASIAAVLTGALENVDRLRQIALENRWIAGTRHRTTTFTAELSRIIEAGAGS